MYSLDSSLPRTASLALERYLDDLCLLANEIHLYYIILLLLLIPLLLLPRSSLLLVASNQQYTML